jgi:hypothetical protein
MSNANGEWTINIDNAFLPCNESCELIAKDIDGELNGEYMLNKQFTSNQLKQVMIFFEQHNITIEMELEQKLDNN